MVTEEPPPNRVLVGAAEFGRCSLRRERQFHVVAATSGTRVHLRHVPAVATPHNEQPVRRERREEVNPKSKVPNATRSLMIGAS